MTDDVNRPEDGDGGKEKGRRSDPFPAQGKEGDDKSPSNRRTVQQSDESIKAKMTEQTEIRQRLIAQGYHPLPLREKMCTIKRWPQRDPLDLIAEYGENGYYLTTGVMLTRNLCAIDWDIADEALFETFMDELERTFGKEWNDTVLIRGRTDNNGKACLLFRTDKPQPQGRSSSWLPASIAGKDGDHKPGFVEIFGSLSSKYIGAFGEHTAGKVDYDWWTESPLDVRYDDLPVVTLDVIEEVCRVMDEIMPGAGYLKVKNQKQGRMIETEAFDLPDMLVTEYGQQKLDEIVDGAKVRMFEILGEGTNVGRGIFHEGYDGRPYVLDWGTWTRHYRASDRRVPLDERTAKLRESLSKIPQMKAVLEHASMVHHALDVEADGPTIKSPRDLRLAGWSTGALEYELTADERAEAAERAERFLAEAGLDEVEIEQEIDRYTELFENDIWQRQIMRRAQQGIAINETGEAGTFWMVADDRPRAGQDLKVSLGRYSRAVPRLTPAGRPSTFERNIVDMMVKDPDTAIVVQTVYDPAAEPGVRFVDDRRVVVNRYTPRYWKDDVVPQRDAGEIFEALLEHLLSNDEGERDFVRNHIAYKVQHPAERGQAVLMYSPMTGTGRSTLWGMLEGLAPEGSARRISTEDIIGESARFNAWQEHALFVFADEISPIASNTGAKAAQAYISAMQNMIDPEVATRSVQEKGRPARSVKIHWTGFFATNYLNSLPLPERDRRVTVMQNRGVTVASNPELQALLARGQTAPGTTSFTEEFNRGLYDYLMAMETDPLLFRVGIETAAKQEAKVATRGQLGHILADVLQRIPEDVDEFWFDVVLAEVRTRISVDAIRTSAKTEIIGLLRAGFEGWMYEPQKTFRVGEGKAKGVMQRVDTACGMSGQKSAEEREVMLGVRHRGSI